MGDGEAQGARLNLDDGFALRPLGAADAALLYETVEQNRAHLDPWLRWSPSLTSAEAARTLLAGIAGAGGTHFGLFAPDGALVGGVICWNIHAHHRFSEVGYWLAQNATGTGLATGATQAVLEHLFREEDVHRIEMLTAESNLRSRAVCERLGFRLESVRRGSHRFPGGFKDHLVYARLAGDAVPAEPPRGLLTKNEFRALVERLAAAWRARDYDAAAACFAEDVRYADPTRYAHAGRAALKAFFADDEGREQKVEWHTVVFDPARQVGALEYTYEGSHRYHGAALVHVSRGRIDRWREHQHVDAARDWDAFAGGTRFP